jgi:hypothetical protein
MQVLLSETFIKSFKSSSLHNKKDVLHYILKISNGWRSHSAQKISEMVNGYKVARCLLITSKDIIMEEQYTQVIKFWDLKFREHFYIDPLAREIESIFETYNDHFTSCSTKQNFEANDVSKV